MSWYMMYDDFSLRALSRTIGNERERENGIYWKDQKDDLDGVAIPTPYLQQFS